MDRIALPIPLYFYLCFSHNHLWPGILLESHGFHYMHTKDNVRTSGVKMQWGRLEEKSRKWRPGSPRHKFPYFLILSRKLYGLCFYLQTLRSWNFKVTCAIILAFQPKIQESSWFCARTCSDLSLSPFLPLSFIHCLILFICISVFLSLPNTVLSKQYTLNICLMFIYNDSNWWMNRWMKIHVHYLFLFQSESFGKVSVPLPKPQIQNYLGWGLITGIFKKLPGNSPL